MSNQRPVVDKKDQTKGIIAAVLIIAAIIIYLKFAFYLMADPPPKDYPVVTELNLPEEIKLEKLVIEGGKTGGAGTPSDDKISPKPEEQTEKTITNVESETTVDSGESNKTNATESQNEASTTVKSKNPFGSGGEDDEGKNTSKNGPFGIDSETDDKISNLQPKINNDNNRKKRKIEQLPDFTSDKEGTIFLQVTINSDGDVTKVICLNNETTITDQRAINQIVSNVKSKVKYNKMPGTTPQTQTLKVKVSRI